MVSSEKLLSFYLPTCLIQVSLRNYIYELSFVVVWCTLQAGDDFTAFFYGIFSVGFVCTLIGIPCLRYGDIIRN
jgi:hypothetical protein